MDYTLFEEAVAKAAASLDLQEYELYYQKDSSDEVSAYQGEVEKFASAVSEGVCFRCLKDGKLGLSSTELFTEAEALALVERALDSLNAVDKNGEAVLYGGGGQYRELPAADYPGARTAMDVEKALGCEKAVLAADSRVEQAQASVGEVARTVRLMNSHGLRLVRSGSMAVAMAEAVADDGTGEKYSDYCVKTAASPDALDTGAVAARAVDKTLSQIGGKPVPSGSYPILMDNSQMAALLEIFAPAFSAQNAQDGLSRLKDREGEQIAAPIVTITDDPFYSESCFKAPFDAEGVATKTKDVVAGGVLKTLLHNLKTAAKAGTQTTGNASKGSYASPVGVSPFTFYLQPGSVSKEELYRQAGEKAVLITFMKGAHAGADAVTGDFSLESKGFLVENGKITRPVQGITVAGNFFELLKNIQGLANDMDFDFSGGTTAFGAPTALIGGLTIAGE